MAKHISLVFAVIGLLFGGAIDVHAAKRVALVIGNSQYEHTQKLTNPENDARLIATILRRQGFDVLEHQNLGFKSMKRAIKAYTSKLEEYGKDTVGLIFYAGHGIQSAGRNYLVPVDAQIAKEGDVEIETISSRALLSGVQFAGNRLNIIILDACRNNPYRSLFRSASRGFARMDAPVGSLVAFSTAPGTVAADGEGVNSPYTSALAKAMVEPGLKIEDVFKRVRASVYGLTSGTQVPWESSSIFGDFYFSDVKATSGPGKVKTSTDLAARTWSASKDTTSVAVLEAFIKQFPKSVFAALARARLSELNKAPEQKVAIGSFPKSEPAKRSFKPGDEFQDCSDCPKMVAVPSGRFMMGAPNSDKTQFDDVRPFHQVSIDYAFAVGKFEVTRKEFDVFIKDSNRPVGNDCRIYRNFERTTTGGNYRKTGFQQNGSHPAVCLNWSDAKAYVSWLSKKTGETYRLLSESEWEYVAKAGSKERFSYGSNVSAFCKHGNVLDRTAKRKLRPARRVSNWIVPCSDAYVYTAPVGSFAANTFGLHDTLGNVGEWLEDCFNPTYEGAPGDGSARNSGNCDMAVSRGGDWTKIGSQFTTSRFFPEKRERTNFYGFRVARTL